jgi:hypothetical protein
MSDSFVARLMALGYTMEDIATAAVETQQIRQERQETLASQKWDKFKFVFESANRKLKKTVNALKPKPAQASVNARQA